MNAIERLIAAYELAGGITDVTREDARRVGSPRVALADAAREELAGMQLLVDVQRARLELLDVGLERG